MQAICMLFLQSVVYVCNLYFLSAICILCQQYVHLTVGDVHLMQAICILCKQSAFVCEQSGFVCEQSVFLVRNLHLLSAICISCHPSVLRSQSAFNGGSLHLALPMCIFHVGNFTFAMFLREEVGAQFHW